MRSCLTARGFAVLLAVVASGAAADEAVLAHIEATVTREMEANRIPGLSIGVTSADGIIWQRGFGYADAQTKLPADQRTLYRVASMTKPVTAFAVLLLVDRGLVDLDAPVSTYVPEFSMRRRPGGEPVTVRHLLCHYSGISRDVYRGISGKVPAPVDLLGILAEDYLAAAPGTEYRYSNVNYALLGVLIERVSGRSYGDFLEEEVFAPLGMADTVVGLENTPEARLAAGHERAGLLFPRTRRVAPQRNRDTAAGSLVSSVVDMLRFARMLLAGGTTADGTPLVSPSLVEEMFRVQFPRGPFDEDAAGLGLKLGKLHVPHRNARHGGTLPGFSSLLALLPDDDFAVVVLYNLNHAFSRHYIADQAMRGWLEARHGAPVSPAGPAPGRPREQVDWPKVVGRYVGVGDFALPLDVRVKAGRPSVILAGEHLALRPAEETWWEVTKRILFLHLNVGAVLGGEQARFTLLPIADTTVPRVELTYRDLVLEMLFQDASSYRSTEAPTEILGTYRITEESLPYAPGGFSHVSVVHEDGYLEARMDKDGINRMILFPVEDGYYQAVGTGETFRFEPPTVEYSGLRFSRE